MHDEIDWEELFKDTYEEPVLEELNNEMALLGLQGKFEEAKVVREQLFRAIDELTPQKSYKGLDRVAMAIKGHAIRMPLPFMRYSSFVALCLHVYGKTGDVSLHIDSWRTTVARSMATLGIDPPRKRSGYKGPNRAFLDVLLKVSANASSQEVMRRERTKLRVALRTGNEAEVKAVKENIRALREREVSV